MDKRQRLESELRTHLSGEKPILAELAKAPRLENWRCEVRRRGKSPVLRVKGEAHGLPKVPDGNVISTNAIVWMDRKCRFVRTRSRLFVLGEPFDGGAPVDGTAT